ncbi:MAG: OmpA family protein [Epsilonproteobacteria bacterium]|nr:OmpA family protein [Campylobacterota bacterium]
MRGKRVLSLVAASLLISSLYAAGDNLFEVGVFGNINYTDNDHILKDRADSYGARLNYRAWDNILVGLEFDYANDAKCRCGGDDDLKNYFLNLIYEGDDTSFGTPYALLGVGYQEVEHEIKDILESGALAQVGGGWKFHLLDFLDLFVEGRYIGDIENEYNNFALTGGINIPFGAVSRPAAEPTKVAAETRSLDSDNDGVDDNLDRCPNTPPGVEVDVYGCPADDDGDGVPNYKDDCSNTPSGVEVDAYGCPYDDDHDGVPNYKDECPNTPSGVEVDSRGCEVVKQSLISDTTQDIDSDGDGVVDSMDQCPDTPSGVVVDDHGCPLIINLHINFDFDSARIKPEYLPKIREVVEFLKAHPAYKAEIQGHTDNIGSREYNKRLSKRRAKAVYEEMIRMGIDPDRLSYEGYGEEHPIASNATPEGRAKNRRVEVHIFY